MIDSFTAAKLLNVPVLALGQMVFDGKLTVRLYEGDYKFIESEVRELLNTDPAYVAKLR